MNDFLIFRLGVRLSALSYAAFGAILGFVGFAGYVWPKSDALAISLLFPLLFGLMAWSRTTVVVGSRIISLQPSGVFGRQRKADRSAIRDAHFGYVDGARPVFELEFHDGTTIQLGPWDPLFRNELIKKCEQLSLELSRRDDTK